METRREGKRPERTVYRLTDAGGRALVDWLRELLARPGRETLQFFAALSFLPNLTPRDALEQLTLRAGRLEAEIAGLDAALSALVPRIGRLVLLEEEYARDLRRAEREWVLKVIDDLREGRLAWDPEQLRRWAELARPGERPSAD